MKSGIKLLIKNAIGLCAVCLLVLADQATKALAVRNLKGKPSYVILDGILEFQYAENRGAAFGMFQNRQMVFAVVTVLVLAVILFLFETAQNTKRMIPLHIVYVLILAGAIGNLIDRVTRNYVVDFIYIRLIHFPNFNVADMCVTVACALLIVLMLFYYKEDEALFFPKKGETASASSSGPAAESEE